MSVTEKLRYLYEADTRSAIKDIEKFGKTAEKEGARAEKSIDKFGRGLTAGGAAAVGFAGIAGAALFSFAKKSEEAHKQAVKLDATLESQPQLAGASKDAFYDLAAALQKTTAADDDAIIGAEALLGQFGLTEDQILRITPLVVDLSRKMGVDMDIAAKAVGKAVNGTSAGLARMGVVIDDDKFKIDALTATQEGLALAVGGFAEKEGKTFSGRLAILGNQINDLQEGIGVGVVDAVSGALGPLTQLSDKFTSLDADTQKAIGSSATYAVGAIGLAGALSLAAGQVIKFRTNLGGAAPTIGKGIGAAAGLAVGYELLTAAFESADRKQTALIEGFIAGTDEASKLEGKIRDLSDQAGLDDLTGDYRKLRDELLAGRDASIDLETEWKQLRETGGDLSKAVALDKLRAYRDEMTKLIDEHGEFAVRSAEASAAQKKFADLLTTGTASEKALATARSALVDTTRKQAEVEEQVSAAVEEGTTTTDKHTEATKKNTASRREQIDTVLAATGSDIAYRLSLLSTSETITEYNEKLKDPEATLRDIERAQLGVKDSLLSTGQAALDSAEQQKGSALSAKEKVDVLKFAWGTFGDQIKPGSPFFAYLLQIEEQLINIAQPRVTTITISPHTTTDGGKPRRQLAHGGRAAAGETVIVGEEGIELFRPDRAGTIIPNHQLRGRGGGGVVVNVSVAPGTDTRAFRSAVYEALVQLRNERGPLGLE